MAFWSTELEAGTRDPKRKFRFKVQFGGLTEDGVVWFAKTVNKPNFTITEAEHTFLNHKFYYPGRVEWQEISMTLVDPVSPNASAQLAAIIRASGYKPPAGPSQLETISKGKAGKALGRIQIDQIDAEGLSIETWVLMNPFIKSVKYGDLDYSDDALIDVELGIRYDWAELIIPTAGLPANVELITGVIEDPKKFFTTEGPTPES